MFLSQLPFASGDICNAYAHALYMLSLLTYMYVHMNSLVFKENTNMQPVQSSMFFLQCLLLAIYGPTQHVVRGKNRFSFLIKATKVSLNKYSS